MTDIEDDDQGVYCSFDEYAALFHSALEVAYATGIDYSIGVYLFIARTEVMRLLNAHFAGRARIHYEPCDGEDYCDTHDGHLFGLS